MCTHPEVEVGVRAGPTEHGLYSEEEGDIWSRLALAVGGASLRTVAPHMWSLSQQHQHPLTPGPLSRTF